MSSKDTQKTDQSGKMKLTAVTLYHGQNRVQRFVNLQHNERGEAILPQRLLDKWLNELHVQRGDTYSVG